MKIDYTSYAKGIVLRVSMEGNPINFATALPVAEQLALPGISPERLAAMAVQIARN